MKSLNDQISRGQSFVHVQATACDRFGSARDRRPRDDFSKTFLRPLRLLRDCQFLRSQSDRNAVALVTGVIKMRFICVIIFNL